MLREFVEKKHYLFAEEAKDWEEAILMSCKSLEADGTVAKEMEVSPEQTACSADTARVLRSMLQSVVEEGIGKDAAPADGTAAGKTGTAQTGQFDEAGEELLNYWFAGFYPAEQPRYTITVLQDGILEPETSSAEIFARVADGLHVMDGQSDA